MHVKASRAVFWSLFSYKELKRITKPFSGHALCCFLIGDEKILACKVWECEESKILRYLLGLKVTQEFWLFCFALSPTLFFYFSCLIFSFTGHLVGFISVGMVFLGKLLRLDEEKVLVGGYWNKIAHNFWVNVTIMNFWFFLWSPWLNHALSRMVWKISSSCTG